ncbi:MAG TPA: polysaccharide pyruvyl transferase family protein [Thermoanaerobaculia bacterium]|nr:polysaccharide pyruvyl transferase family protein [Thermoanaerobaculia bacterium]HUM29394.1 polysaccharide pyruvyl transferase family protein [Thermoanaerobaculia bacterium]HXK67640.1 polysaccharide pyruvyl transferase family protein [Thermoanaerobaculia bacterium]
MIFEVRGAGFVNKGAELMLRSVIDQLNTSFQNCKIVIDPIYATRENRISLGLYKKARIKFLRHAGQQIVRLIPEKIRKTYGMITESEIDAVIDISGFAYGDKWGTIYAREMASACKRWKHDNKKVILLPQAFGPFLNHALRKYVRTIINLADIVYARDSQSFQFLQELDGPHLNIREAPDFTVLLDGIPSNEFKKDEKIACIVPNFRMIDMTSGETEEDYLLFLVRSIEYLHQRGITPCLLLHEYSSDIDFGNKIQSALPYSLKMIQKENPLHIKGILGSSYLVMASRFHALVGALSQGIPTIGTGWSHKYDGLFGDYGCMENLISSQELKSDPSPIIDRLLNYSARTSLVQNLKAKAENHRKLVLRMWEEVLEFLRN